MARWTVTVSWSAGAMLLACAAITLAAPVENTSEEAEGEVVEVSTLVPPSVNPKITLDLPQVPNSIIKNTLIASSVLLELGALDTDTDEDIDIHGTTVQPAPRLIVDSLPGSVAQKEEEKVLAAENAAKENTTTEGNTESDGATTTT